MSISAFEHPFLSGLAGDNEVAALLGPQAEIDAMLAFETALAEAEAEFGVIPEATALAIAATLTGFTADFEGLKSGTARDGVVIPEFVKQMRAAVGAPHAEHLHFGATSQDVIDTALILRLKRVVALFEQRLAALEAGFENLSNRAGQSTLMGHTRMQAAIPITVADRIESWRAPLARHRDRLSHSAKDLLVVQFGGAAGTLEKLGTKGPAVRASLAARLGLGDAAQWHSQRDRIADFANLLALVTGSLGKFGQDIALLAQMGVEIRLTGGGGSSAMPHKQNPVQAELLVTLARYNAVQLSGIHQAMVHEQERSGAAWTLEWLILPQMVLATGAATLAGLDLIRSIASLGNAS
ncbi:3-carboxy-cis,cis-muconate cycloisomerase [Oryzicola mucosus]|uniref:3-carboxy-cis,cis-muconate cycloisomerase n=1 Tax=Oryzicola mucosus TaxID=2767425 RepID=A0A8J6PIG7_9HYPH|nr:3-carboxy-cis,cis-muconate cycloisomerase [Oryzicola mucosus]MBD0415504.1 3-carboxy-cis,cis-muconate cycloisomerase [Oryzicola mucosus]